MIDSIIDECIGDCHNKYFHTFDHICEFDFKIINITNFEIINIKISDKSMGLYDLNEKLTVARGNGFIFNHINKLTTKIFSNLSHINIHYYLKLRILIMHRQFFRNLSQNRECIQSHCNDRRKPFHFACRQWFSKNIPQC